MESKKEVMHTPEPWSYANGDGHYEGAVVIIGGRMTPRSPLAHIRDICGDAEADARRIVACVNFCSGLGTEVIEAGTGETGWLFVIADEVRKLSAKRDELLEALKYHQEQTRPIQRTIDVIAKCEVQS